jgi:two-component system phosphate regulon sensor histidine kinase PhoR
MRVLSHRVQLFLFVAAVLVPCAVLIALSVRFIGQDRELLVKRQTDEQRQIVVRGRDALLAALRPILLDEIRVDLRPGQAYRHPETVFVGWTEADRLVLPWEPERDQAARNCRELISQPGFEPAIRACEQLGNQPHELSLTTGCYERAVAAATHPLQAAYARWLLAQALDAAGGRPGQAAQLFRGLLDAGPEVTDADGIPLGLHAARALLQAGAADRRILSSVERALAQRPWLPPMSSFVVTEIVERLARAARNPEEKRAAGELTRKAAGLVRLLQQAEALQNDFPRLRAVLFRPQPSWAAYGDEVWLAGAAGSPQASGAIVVVRGQDVFGRLVVPGVARFADSREPAGEPLGEAFPGLKVVMASTGFSTEDPAGDLQRRAFYAALLLVVLVTMFAAYLLWRDLKREMRSSDLRAQFVSSVSHELKTPLTAIRMFAETLQLGRCGDPETQSEYLGTIVNECERLSRLVDGVLLFSKAEQGKKTWRFRPVEPAGAVQAAVRALEYPLSQQGFRLHMAIEDSLPRITADRDALEQAVLNLLSNAIKYSGDARDIELGLYHENGEVVLKVTDHGIGIAPEEHSRIFEKFYRAPAPENQFIPGTGLGLALVAQIVKAHGGRLAVDSAPGQGSTFYLRFPHAP